MAMAGSDGTRKQRHGGGVVGMASYGTIDASIWQVKVACRDAGQAEESVRHGIGMATMRQDHRSMATERGRGNID
jgi:hypothetical protein